MIIELKQAVQQALEALTFIRRQLKGWDQGDPVIDALRAALAAQTEVTDGIRPEDFTVDVVVKSMGGFAQINTKGVRVTHKPTGISVMCDVARSQHANRNQAIETLRAILALRPERVPMTDEEIEALFGKCGGHWNGDQWVIEDADLHPFTRAILALRPERVPMTYEQISLEAHNADDRDWNDLRFRSSWHEGFLEGARFAEAHHGITTQPKKETP